MKGVFGFSEFLDLAFLFIEEIWHDVQKGSWSILSSIPFQTFAVSTAINDLVDLCPNLWCNNSKATFFLGANLFYFYFIPPKKACFRCALCGKVTGFFSLSPKYTVQNPCEINKYIPKLINDIIENNLSHRSVVKSTFCNSATKGFPLLSNIFIWTCTLCFAATWCPSATSICLSVYSNEPGIKY